MRFSTVCFLFEVPPLQTYYERYDMHEFVQKGYKVMVYDMSPLINPIAYNNRSKGLLDENRNVVVRHIASIKELKAEIKDLKDVFFWSTIPLFSASYKIFKVISKYGYGFICNVDYVPAAPATHKREIKHYLQSVTWKRLKESVFSRIPRKYLPIKKSDAILTYTENNIRNITVNALCDDNTKIELVNTLDYNEFVRCESKKDRILDRDYCVFIDQFFPLHPDGKAIGLNITAQIYYEHMTVFLKKVQDVMGMPVVIAAHPKANYDEHPQYFSEFQIYQFCTCELVRNSKMVISHPSISLSFVVLSHKPLLLVATDEMLWDNKMQKAFQNAVYSVAHEVVNVSDEDIISDVENIIRKELDADNAIYEIQKEKYKLDSKKYKNANKTFFEVMQECMESV